MGGGQSVHAEDSLGRKETRHHGNAAGSGQIIGAEAQPGMQELSDTTHGRCGGEGGSFKTPTRLLSKCAGSKRQGTAGCAPRKVTPAEIEQDPEAGCGQATKQGLVEQIGQIDRHGRTASTARAIKTPVAMKSMIMITTTARAVPSVGWPSRMSYWASSAGTPGTSSKIGRASCRERVEHTEVG